MKTSINFIRAKVPIFFPIPLPLIAWAKCPNCQNNNYIIGFHLGNYQCTIQFHNEGKEVEKPKPYLKVPSLEEQKQYALERYRKVSKIDLEEIRNLLTDTLDVVDTVIAEK